MSKKIITSSKFDIGVLQKENEVLKNEIESLMFHLKCVKCVRLSKIKLKI